MTMTSGVLLGKLVILKRQVDRITRQLISLGVLDNLPASSLNVLAIMRCFVFLPYVQRDDIIQEMKKLSQDISLILEKQNLSTDITRHLDHYVVSLQQSRRDSLNPEAGIKLLVSLDTIRDLCESLGIR